MNSKPKFTIELGQMGFFRIVPIINDRRQQPMLGHRYPTAYAAELAARELGEFVPVAK